MNSVPMKILKWFALIILGLSSVLTVFLEIADAIGFGIVEEWLLRLHFPLQINHIIIICCIAFGTVAILSFVFGKYWKKQAKEAENQSDNTEQKPGDGSAAL